jgi:chorismate dehydratase
MEINPAQQSSIQLVPGSELPADETLDRDKPFALGRPAISQGPSVAAVLRNNMSASLEPDFIHSGSRVKPRLGQISFINALPIVVPIASRAVVLDAEMFYGEPVHLNTALDRGLADISAVSSLCYLTMCGVTLVPSLSISSRTEVGSVLLFSKLDLDQLNDKPVAVPNTSATSVSLLKILLAETYSVVPKIIRVHSPDPYDDAFAASCLFGDRALKFDSHRRNDKSRQLHRHDLGSWWHRMTGLPMVFAVWIARDDWISHNYNIYVRIAAALARSANLGCGEMLPEVVGQARRRVDVAEAVLNKYYRNQLCFELGAVQIESIKIFSRLCRAHRLLNN